MRRRIVTDKASVSNSVRVKGSYSVFVTGTVKGGLERLKGRTGAV